jgi:predicted PurR-regulated permease PerM
MTDNQNIKKWIVVGIIVGLFILAFFVIEPIIMSIIFGLLFAYVFTPVYKKINSRIKNKNVSAIILILTITILIAVPLIYLTPRLIRQVVESYATLKDIDFRNILGHFFQAEIATTISANLDNLLGQFFNTIINWMKVFVVNLPSIFLQLVVFLFTFYFATRDSEQLKNYLVRLSPFSTTTGNKFLKEFRGITNAIIYGQVLIGIIQGLLLGIGLYFLGVPGVLILTFIACVVSIIPVLGAWLVWFPVGIILLAGGKTFSGIFILLYGGFFISLIDNFMRPYILSKRSNLGTALSVIGTIGGLYVFGIAGLVLGPLIIAYILIIIDFYQQGKLNELFKNEA